MLAAGADRARFDGTLFHIGSPKLHWIKDVRIEPQQLQVLEPSRRRYGHAIETDREGIP